MKMRTRLRGLATDGGRLRFWTGIPVGYGVSYAAGKLMPEFAIESPYLYPLPYFLPALALGGLALASPKTKRAGLGVLGTTAAFYLWTIFPALSGQSDAGEKPGEYVDYTKSDKLPPYMTTEGAPVAVMY